MKTIAFTLALFASCGGSSSNHAPVDGATLHDAALRDASASCAYPQVAPDGATNDARCPANYSPSFCTPAGQGCENNIGLHCAYYGAGDGRSGCYAIAAMQCVAADGSSVGVWVCEN